MIRARPGVMTPGAVTIKVWAEAKLKRFEDFTDWLEIAKRKDLGP